MNIRVNVCTRNPVSCSIKPRYQHRSDGTSRAFCSPIACSNVRLILFRSKRTDRIECRRFINIRHPNPLTRGFGFKNNKVIFLIAIIDKRNLFLSIGKIITITIRNIFELQRLRSLESDGKGNRQQCIDQFIQLYIHNTSESRSRPLIPTHHRISKHARYPNKRVTVKTSYTFVSRTCRC